MELHTILRLATTAFEEEVSATICQCAMGPHAEIEGKAAFLLTLERLLKEEQSTIAISNTVEKQFLTTEELCDSIDSLIKKENPEAWKKNREILFNIEYLKALNDDNDTIGDVSTFFRDQIIKKHSDCFSEKEIIDMTKAIENNYTA